MNDPEIIIVPSLFLMIAYVTYTIANGFARRQQVRASAEFHAKLLDRIGNVREFSEFLNTEGGQQFLRSTATPTPPGFGPQYRILWALQSGIVLMFLGIALFIYTAVMKTTFDDYEAVAFFATVATAVGAGLLVSSALSLALSRRLGLINGTHRTESRQLTPST